MKTLKNLTAVIVVLFSVVIFTSCNNEDNEPRVRTELLGIDNGNSNEGGIWSVGTFYNPTLQFTKSYYVVVSEDSQTFEFYFETNQNEFVVTRIFPDATTGSPLTAYFTTDKAPANAVTDHSKYNYEVDIDWITSAQVIMNYNGIRVKSVVSLVKSNTFGDI